MTGKGRSRFIYCAEMNDLLGCRDDINFVVTANSTAVTVYRPESVTPTPSESTVGATEDDNVSDTEWAATGTTKTVTNTKGKATTSRASVPISTPTSRTKCIKPTRPVSQRKRRRDGDDAVLEYLRQNGEKVEARETEILNEMKHFHKCFTDAMTKIADRL